MQRSKICQRCCPCFHRQMYKETGLSRMDRLNRLYEQLQTCAAENFFTLESDFFLLLYAIPLEQRPVCVTAFLTISNWLGVSFCSGVWTFYETADPAGLLQTLDFLRATGYRALAAALASGIHDYQSPQYAENYDYPQEWLDGSEQLDGWITAQENTLNQWMINLLLSCKESINACFS